MGIKASMDAAANTLNFKRVAWLPRFTNDFPLTLRVSPNGRHAAVYFHLRYVILHDLTTEGTTTRMRTVTFDNGHRLYDLRFSVDGQNLYAVVCVQTSWGELPLFVLHTWNVATGLHTRPTVITFNILGRGFQIAHHNRCVFKNDRVTLELIDDDAIIHLFNATNVRVQTMFHAQCMVTCHAHVWLRSTVEPFITINSFCSPTGPPVAPPHFSDSDIIKGAWQTPDESVCIVVMANAVVQWYRVSDKALLHVHTLERHPAHKVCVAVASDSQCVAFSTGLEVQLWSVPCAQLLETVTFIEEIDTLEFANVDTIVYTTLRSHDCRAIDVGGPKRTMARMRAVEQELMAAAWHPRRVVDWCFDVTEAREMNILNLV